MKNLMTFASKHGVDLQNQIKHAEKHDQDALAHIFSLAPTFDRFDLHARAYGHLLYANFLWWGETAGVDSYVAVVNRQPANIKQRVRDFLYYPVTVVEEPHRREVERQVRDQYRSLFPRDFKFAKDDSIFVAKR